MYRPLREQDEAMRGEARRTAALMGFIVVLVLAITGVMLIQELRKTTGMEDCLMSGRRNCAPIEAPPRQPE